jgi:hypothetical protein
MRTNVTETKEEEADVVVPAPDCKEVCDGAERKRRDRVWGRVCDFNILLGC